MTTTPSPENERMGRRISPNHLQQTRQDSGPRTDDASLAFRAAREVDTYSVWMPLLSRTSSMLDTSCWRCQPPTTSHTAMATYKFSGGYHEPNRCEEEGDTKPRIDDLRLGRRCST